MQLIRPETLRLYHRALFAAQEEVDLACSCFGPQERDAAAKIARRSANAEAPMLSSRERDVRVMSMIERLPSVVGTALTAADLQRQLDAEYAQQRRLK